MAEVARSENWKRWAGSLDDIASLAKRAVELIGPDDKGVQHCQIEVVLPGLDTTYHGPDEFIDDVRESDRARIERVSIRVGSYAQSQRVVVAFDDYRAPRSRSTAKIASRSKGRPGY